MLTMGQPRHHGPPAMPLRGLLAALALTCLAAPAAAQWAQGAPGRVWVKSALFIQVTDEEYSVTGERRTRLGGGESDAKALFTDVIVGLRRDLDLWVQIPFYDFRYRDVASTLDNVGFGDVRAWLRWQFLGMGTSTPVALRLGAKAPIAESPIDAQIIPLGEGQWDLEGFLEVGHSFWPVPAYAEVWLGYRARFANDNTLKDPGGEYVFLAEAGIQPTGHTLLKTSFDGFFARNLRSEGVVTANRRRIATLQFAGAVRAGPVWPEFSVRIPVGGREFPAGIQYVIGISSQIR